MNTVHTTINWAFAIWAAASIALPVGLVTRDAVAPRLTLRGCLAGAWRVAKAGMLVPVVVAALIFMVFVYCFEQAKTNGRGIWEDQSNG